MKPGKTLWLLKIHFLLPDLEAPVHNLRLCSKKISSLASLGIIFDFKVLCTFVPTYYAGFPLFRTDKIP